MLAEDKCRREVVFDGTAFDFGECDIDSCLESWNRRMYVAYQWSVWTTALVRRNLHIMCRDIAGSRFVYADTDSCKFQGCNADDLRKVEAYNAEQVRKSKERKAFAVDQYGVTHYMGIFEKDAEYRTTDGNGNDKGGFITLGSKKYAYADPDGTCHVTVSGVNKKEGGKELQEAGGLEAFKEGFIWRKAGGSESVYNDTSDYHIEIDGHDLHITPNVTIKDSSYTLGLTEEYRRLLQLSNLKELVANWQGYEIK